MPFYRSGDPGAKNRWRRAVGDATSRRMERTKCPKCGRKGALKTKIDDYGDGIGARVTWCRWRESGKCDYTKVTPYGREA